MDIEVLRARTTFVLQVMERALGEFASARALLSDSAEALVSDPAQNPKTFGDRVSESYLGDLFGLALGATQGTTAFAEILHLKALAESLSIYEIRNACAHPNRPFFPHYWYRIATLAQDPSFKLLGIEKVSAALASAESDSFTRGSESWTVALRRVVANNLPLSFEHDRTGLIGREQLINECVKLVGGRFPTIALVAPGGTGKTALALEVLKKVAYAQAGLSDFEAVVFVSLKNQKLTVGGLEVFAELPTVEDLEGRIGAGVEAVFEDRGPGFSEFAQVESAYGHRKILLCIDNLENVLLSQASEFEDLLCKLPPSWRVLITTRVPLNAAHCLTVGALHPAAGGHLSISYSRSVGLKLEKDSTDRIAQICKNNPLAIKLTVDAIAAGQGVDDALTHATSGTLQFSYDLLLEVLPAKSVAVLEALFAAGPLSRSDLSLVLKADADDIASSLGLLSRTSLLHRSAEAGIERFALNDSVRELLRVHPVNLQLRSDVSKAVAMRRHHDERLLLEAERDGESKNSIYFVPPDHPSALREISRDVKKGRRSDLESALSRLSILEGDCQGVSTFWLLRAAALMKCKDPLAEHAICRAVDIEESIRTVGFYGYWLQRAKRFREAADQYLRLKGLGGCDKADVGPALAEKNASYLLVSSLCASRYVDVMELSHEFVIAGVPSLTLCFARASAARNLYRQERSAQYLEECLDVLDVAFAKYGYTSNLSKEGLRIIRDVWNLCRLGKFDPVLRLGTLKFAVEHYEAIVLSVRPDSEDSWWATANLLEMVESGDDAQLVSRLQAICRYSDVDGAGVRSIPVTIVEFTHAPDLLYRFADDREGKRHYLRWNEFEGDRSEWRCLLPWLQVYIVPGELPGVRDEYPRAKAISLRPILEHV